MTLKLLEDMGIDYFVIAQDTSEEETAKTMEGFRKKLAVGKDVAFVICEDALSYGGTVKYGNGHTMVREEIIRHIVEISGEDPIVCTTGKASRELFEVRTAKGQDHKYDFLTVGSMGHSSSIALGIAVIDAIELCWYGDEYQSVANGDLYFELYGWDCDSIVVLNPNAVVPR